MEMRMTTAKETRLLTAGLGRENTMKSQLDTNGVVKHVSTFYILQLLLVITGMIIV